MEKEPDSGVDAVDRLKFREDCGPFRITHGKLIEALDAYFAVKQALLICNEESSWGSSVSEEIAERLKGISLGGIISGMERNGISCLGKEI